MECLSPIGEYHLRNTSHDFELVCFLARRGNVHVLFLQRLSKCARTNYTNSWLTSISESLRVPSGCHLSLGYSRSGFVCPKHTVSAHRGGPQNVDEILRLLPTADSYQPRHHDY